MQGYRNRLPYVEQHGHVVAKAYIDQLERSQALPASQIASLRQAIQIAEASKGNYGKLKGFSGPLAKSAAQAKSSADANRMRSLAEILRQPSA